MLKIVEGYHRFQTQVLPQKRALYEKLAAGQHPNYLFITCDDSRVDPIQLTDAAPGDLFVERNIGNIIPKPEAQEHEAIAAVEFAVVALQVEHIVVCGHSKCGAMMALMNPDSLAAMPTVATWLRNAGAVRENVARKYGHLEGDALLDAMVHENVVIQLDRLKLLPSVASRLDNGRLDIHGWVFDIETGAVEAYSPAHDRFLPLDEAYPAAPV